MAQQVISFHYTLKDKEGNTIDTSRDKTPMSFLEGAGQIIPGLEVELLKCEQGKKTDVTVACQQAYGERDDRLIQTVPRTQIPSPEVKVGDMFRVGSEQSNRVVTVTNLTETEVTLDANHPLAGEDLNFEIEITGKRDATEEELAHGHAHDGDGHHHH